MVGSDEIDKEVAELMKTEIDWESDDDDDGYSAYASPAEVVRRERRINKRMRQRAAGYKPGNRAKGISGQFDYTEDDEDA